MAISKKKRTQIILLISLLLLGIAGGFYLYKPAQKASESSVPTQKVEQKEADKKVQSLPKNTQPSPTQSSKLEKPILIKSSGNNGPVPEGAILEFVCNTKAGYNCRVMLTDQTNAGRIIDLGSKTASADSRGSAGATWNWAAAKGKWFVLAEASFNGAKAESDKQTLEVN